MDISSEAALALTAGELSNGNLNLQPWMMAVDNDHLQDAVALGIVNIPYLMGRCETLGINARPFEGAVAYALLTALLRLSVDEVWKTIKRSWSGTKGKPPSAEIQRAAIRRVMERVAHELVQLCSSDCERVSQDEFVTYERDVRDSWKRLRLPGDETYNEERRSPRIIIVTPKEPCKLGLEVADDINCPLTDTELTMPITRKLLQAFKTAIERIVAEGKRKERRRKT